MTEAAKDTDPMNGRIVRFDDLRRQGTAIMFIDSILPGHLRMNFSVIGDTASENPDFKPMMTADHQFQIGMFEAPPNNGPGWHTHDYVELFMPLSGNWRFLWSTSPTDPESSAKQEILGPWDVISFPPDVMRRFENASEENAWGFAVLDPHEHFTGPDPRWPDFMIDAARERGLKTDGNGKLVIPNNFRELEAEVTARINATQGPAVSRTTATRDGRARV
jgi:quercetin dioxygenase-like cupin family protein